ncbi:unnamed protein product [Mytilus edulis]|uniref:Uncharacterized protein n=1 Tax=Mytilus edulis TaxID=6550 RepID=A0A8S3QR39_MYTED|nr:unnamed protein product [Mytilus edulis]
MLVKIFGGPLMKKIKDDDPSAYLDLFREFETVKRTITPEKDSKVNITIPYASLDTHCNNILGENLADVLGSSPYSKQIAVRGDKMRVDADVMKALFKPTIDNIISLMKEILQNKAASDVSQLLLVADVFPQKCEKIFNKIVEKDQEISLGQKFTTGHLTVVPMQKEMKLQIYVSTNKTPMYTDETSSTYLGSATITFLVPTEDLRNVKAEYIFGNTEISMKAVDEKTGTNITASFDLI